MSESGTTLSEMLPNRDGAYVDRSKIVDYLLCPSHPDGSGKAMFFSHFGFKSETWRTLADALCQVGASNPVVAAVESSHGIRYTVDGPLKAPNGRFPRVRTIWIVEPNGTAPRLITAYPA